LQRVLHSCDGKHPVDIVAAEGDWICLSTGADLWLDVAQFEQRFALSRGVPGRELDTHRAQALREATDLYRGDLLLGWYQDWCLCERARLQDMYLAMLDKLMDYAETRHDYETAIDDGAQILRYNRAHERTHRRLMRLYYLADDRTAALRQYDQCAAALDEELGVRPARRTVAVYEQIRADSLDDATFLGVVGDPVERVPASGYLPEHRHELQRALTSLHEQIVRTLSALEESLPNPE
jgi:DNA-binding SARP family transcriptional activator